MPFRAIAATILATLCWGINFTASKFALQGFTPILLLTIRFFMVAAILAPFALPLKPWPRMRDMLIVATTLITLQFGFMFTALHMGLSISGLVIASQMGAPFACLLSAMVYKDYLGPWRSFGLMVAMLGVLLVAGTPDASEHWAAFLLGIAGSFAWAVANIYTKRVSHLPVMALQFWPPLLAAPQLLVLCLLIEPHPIDQITQATWQSWLGLSYSIFISSLVGYGLWNWVIRRYPLSQVVPYTLLTPIVGISVGAMAFAEPFSLRVLLGAALTIAGVGIISLRRPKLADPEMN